MFSFDLLKIEDKDSESISYDIIINRDYFRCNLISKVKEVISDVESLKEFILPILDFIKILTDGKKSGMQKFEDFFKFCENV